MAPIETLAVFEDSGFYLMARFKSPTGANGVQADITSISLSVFDESSTTAIAGPTALTVSAVVFDTLQTTILDPRWTKDSTGYNFAYSALAAHVPNPGWTRFEFKFTPASGQVFFIVFRVPVAELYTS